MMGCVEEKIRTGILTSGASPNLLDEMKLLREIQDQSGTRKAVNSELWYACAGPLVSLPQVGSLVYYFPQGHSEQVAVSTRRMATSQVPNYPNLPSQLLCQVHNVTLHADKDTDEIYAQMSLQPVNSEKDVFPIPDFGLKPSNHPTEFFCKTLTASDTSTHGGFSVPRRAAEKLFPPLDYTMQPPTQELVIRDLHDNTWTFRHIYRGQPKRHLLTTGWSLFVGSKRLKAGDSVLFVRDEKSQLLVGVRQTNRQQTTLPSSVLSADSMHIGVLAAAAHAAANRSQFTIFYNPRACPSEFVVPVSRYRKAVYGTQISVGMRFGMMFETEESGKRRYMGTIIGISDLDPLRWRGSKWRNLQVEWDEQVCSDKQNRVSQWEIETPDSLFIFPSLTSGFKRPFHSGFSGGGMEWGNLIKRPLIWLPENGNVDLPYSSISNLCSEQLIKMLLKPQVVSDTGIPVSGLQGVSGAKLSSLEDGKTLQGAIKQTVHINQPHTMPMESQNYSPFFLDQSNTIAPTKSDDDVPEMFHSQTKNQNCSPNEMCMGKLKPEPEHSTDQLSQLTSTGDCNGEKASSSPLNPQDSGNKLVFQNPDQGNLEMQASLLQIDPLLEPLPFQTHQTNVPQVDSSTLNVSPSSLDGSEWTSNPCVSLSGMYRSLGPSSLYGFQEPPALFPEAINPSLPLMNRDVWHQQLSNSKFSSQDPSSLNASGMKDLSEESQDQSGIYGSLYIDVSHGGGAVMDEFCSLKDVDFQNASDCLVGNFSSSQDVQSQITSASLADSQAFSQQDFPDSSGGTSSSNLDFDKNNLLQNGPWQQLAPRVRTYTKVQKTGCVGRSIDVSSFKNYEELCSAIECMFGLEGLLNNRRDSGWKLVYVDYENDVLLIGDDPWEEFVGCVRCIRILSPSEVQQMSEEGMKLLNNATLQAIGGPSADGSHCLLAN